MAGTNSLKRFLKNLLVQRNTKINKKNVMASIRCHGDSDCNKTQIIRNSHLYGDEVNAQTWEVSPQ